VPAQAGHEISWWNKFGVLSVCWSLRVKTESGKRNVVLTYLLDFKLDGGKVLSGCSRDRIGD
jgi:hypothetical protein